VCKGAGCEAIRFKHIEGIDGQGSLKDGLGNMMGEWKVDVQEDTKEGETINPFNPMERWKNVMERWKNVMNSGPSMSAVDNKVT